MRRHLLAARALAVAALWRYADTWSPHGGVPNPGGYGNPDGGQPAYPYPLGPTILFADDFETGNLAKWTNAYGDWAVSADTPLAGAYSLVGGPAYRALQRILTTTPLVSGVTFVHATVVIPTGWGDGTIFAFEGLGDHGGVAQLNYTTGVGLYPTAIFRDDSGFSTDGPPTLVALDTPLLLGLAYDITGANPVARAYVGGILVAEAVDESGSTPLSTAWPSELWLYKRARVDDLTVADGVQGV